MYIRCLQDIHIVYVYIYNIHFILYRCFLDVCRVFSNMFRAPKSPISTKTTLLAWRFFAPIATPGVARLVAQGRQVPHHY